MAVPDINYLAVLVAAISQMIIGAIWYGPLFGKEWINYMGFKKDKKSMQKMKEGAKKSYIWMFIGSVITAMVFSYIIDYADATTAIDGMIGGFWIWIGFVVPLLAGMVLWEGKSKGLYYINVGYYLVSLMIMGAIIAVWM